LIENNNGSNFIATFTVTTASLENAGIHFNRDGKTSVSFSCTTNTGYGRELYVVGSHPDVGNWTPTEARKLYWTSGNVWTGHIAIEAGTALEYKYIIRTNTADAFTNAGNVIWMPGNNLSVNMPGQSPGPYDAKSFYYYSGWSNVSLVYQCGTDTNWYSTNMSVYGQGRTPDEYVYHVDGFGRPGALLTFTVSGYSVTQQWDHSPATGGNYYTPLDTVLLRDGQIYNYWPTGALDASRIETTYITSAWAPTIPSRNIRVYLPRGYNQNTQKCYPVLYMHDGQNDFRPGGAFGCWYAEDTADDLISLGMMRETVIVAVDNTSERNREYIPPMDDCGDGQGTADQYANFLIHDVKTYVDGNYRTLPDRNNTLTLGSSFGGNVSMYLGLATNVFSKVGPMSPAFWAATNFIQDYIVDGDASGLRIYMDMGTEEGTGAWVRVWNVYNDLLADDYTVNDTLRMEAGAGQEHNEAAWAQRLPMPFSFLMDIRDEPNELTLQEHPARISGFVAEDGTPSIRFDGLQGFAFVLQKTASLSSPEWNAICTGAVENAMWGSQQLVDTNTLDAQSTYRTLALPLNQQAE
jgi:predicted alpha/beta superfamily hydrolase